MKHQKKCQVIKYSSHSLLGSINDILDFSKIEKGTQVGKTQFSPKVFESLKNNEIQAKRQRMDFRFSISNDVPKLVEGDENRLVQILNNV
jgi:signal transduction histidine kinase